MEKKIIQEAVQNNGVYFQWFMDWYGWAIAIIGGLLSVILGLLKYIGNRFLKRLKKLEKKVEACQTEPACKEFRDGIKDETIRVERECEKDVAILKNDMAKALDKIDDNVTGLHERFDAVLLASSQNRKRDA